MTVNPVCWSWPAECPTKESARQETFSYAERLGCTPEQAQVLWDLERAAGVMSDDDVLARWHDGRCAICGRASDLVCDHDHQTGLVRGWLCRSCNAREGANRQPGTIFARYRECHPAAILGLTVRYLNPVTGEYTEPERQREIDWADKWSDAASEDIGL